MNRSAKAWVQALRSGRFKQGHGALQRGDEYCCLGVACRLYQEEVGGLCEKPFIDEITLFDSEGMFLPTRVRDWLGLTDAEGTFTDYNGRVSRLYSLNDLEKSFNEIAEIIEEEPKGLFLENKTSGE